MWVEYNIGGKKEMELVTCKEAVFELLQMSQLIQRTETNDVIDNFAMVDLLSDSLSYVTFVIMIEEKFQIEVPDELLLTIADLTLNDFCIALVDHINAN